MKKIIIYSLLFFVVTSFKWIDEIYSINFNSIQGNKIDLNDYKGKKVLFVILPFADQDKIYVNQITDFEKDHNGNLVVIGILANDLGYTNDKKNEIVKMYEQDRNSTIIITEGMNIKKGANQADLPKWLTNNQFNGRFNNDISTTGYKYFVDEAGRLYAVIGPEVPLNHPVFSRILSKPLGN